MRNRHRKCDCQTRPPQGDGNIYYNSLNNDCRRRYGPLRFLFDLFMVVITSGFWLIWIFVREMRNR